MKKKRKFEKLNISQFFALVFVGVILLGTALLCLPVSSRSTEPLPFMTALFTSTSATCVTGLVLGDTWTLFSGFGQAVILCMIEIGGLGFMSAVSMLIFLLRKKVSMTQSLLMAQAVGTEDSGEAVKLQKRAILGSLLIELTGAAVLTVRFMGEYGFFKSLQMGVFHSVSAFCNAGFDIMGFRSPGSSIISYGTDPTVCITIALLIILGGLGFVVWDEALRVRSPKKWSVYTKLVLITTGLLLLLGTLAFCFSEWNNPETLGGMSVGEKLLAAFFQSATTRTAGFSGISQGGLSESGKAFSIVLMLIGGSSGSTAGGLKTVTFTVLVLFLYSKIRGRNTVTVFNRRIPEKNVLNALTVFGIMTGLMFFGATFICCVSPVGFTDALFETVSALATVGSTTGITASLSPLAHILLIVYMYFGRVGIMTISLGFLYDRKNKNSYKYAQTNLLIG